MKVWDALARLDGVAKAVKAGNYIQPIYTTHQIVKLLPEPAPAKSNLSDLDRLDAILGLNEVSKPTPIVEKPYMKRVPLVVKKAMASVDWDSLSKLAEVKF